MTLLKKYKIIITVLAALLSVSMVLLTVQTVKRLRTASDEVTVRNNSIGAVEENWEFGGAGLLPGDSESKTYTVRLSHKEDLMLAFSVQVSDDANGLADALIIKVEDEENGQVICDEKLSTAAETVHLEKIFFNGNKERKIPYRITVTVDEAADGTAQDASLGLSFRWSVLSAESKEGDAK